ncbi:hypothetical protein ACFLWA_07585 [Chloroflexota bacterium]
MKQKKMKEQATGNVGGVLVININLTRRLAAFLAGCMLLAAFLGYLAWGQGEVAASPQAPLESSTGMRQFYLTQDIYTVPQAGSGVCADGYHFASMWELMDPSNLQYNTDLGRTQDDSGQGPPSNLEGWVRTGYASIKDSTVGTGNCENWTVADSTEGAPWARLNFSWETPGAFPAWVVGNTYCDLNRFVWCVED